MLKQMLKKMLEAKLSQNVQQQLKAGVGPIPASEADELLLQVAQLPHDRLRGLIVIAAVDIEDPARGAGLDVRTIVAGNASTLEPLLELGAEQISEKLEDPTRTVDGEICPGCGEVHGQGEDFLEELLRRGPGGGKPDNALEGLMLALALGPLARKVR